MPGNRSADSTAPRDSTKQERQAPSQWQDNHFNYQPLKSLKCTTVCHYKFHCNDEDNKIVVLLSLLDTQQ